MLSIAIVGSGCTTIPMNQEPLEPADICTVCHEETRGGFEVYERTREDGVPMIVIESTPDRNFNVCDGCNDAICFRCSARPESGYCNRCLDAFDKVEPNPGPEERTGTS